MLPTIVGVVSDFTPIGAENGKRPQIFSPYLKLDDATLMVRTRGAPESYGKALQNAVWSLDRDLPADKVLTMDYYMNDILAQRKFNTLLIGIFAALALLLAMMGIYGVLSNLVASRVREIGIRMAIGATPGEIGGLMLRQSMIPVALGLAIGLAGTFALSRFLEALLFRVQPRDPLTLAVAAMTDSGDFASGAVRPAAPRHQRGLHGRPARRVTGISGLSRVACRISLVDSKPSDS